MRQPDNPAATRPQTETTMNPYLTKYPPSTWLTLPAGLTLSDAYKRRDPVKLTAPTEATVAGGSLFVAPFVLLVYIGEETYEINPAEMEALAELAPEEVNS